VCILPQEIKRCDGVLSSTPQPSWKETEAETKTESRKGELEQELKKEEKQEENKEEEQEEQEETGREATEAQLGMTKARAAPRTNKARPTNLWLTSGRGSPSKQRTREGEREGALEWGGVGGSEYSCHPL
jgi:hypothetical protein